MKNAQSVCVDSSVHIMNLQKKHIIIEMSHTHTHANIRPQIQVSHNRGHTFEAVVCRLAIGKCHSNTTGETVGEHVSISNIF